MILPKQLTDDFYATWKQCYEELFHASLSPKYVQRKDSIATPSATTTPAFKDRYNDGPSQRNGQLQHSVSELNLASACNDDLTTPMTRSRDGARSRRHNKRMQRLSLDVSNMNLGFTSSNLDLTMPEEHPFRRANQRHLSDSAEPSSRLSNNNVSGGSNFSKFFGALNGRKKVYKFSNGSLPGMDYS